jgi:hypothetical protein
MPGSAGGTEVSDHGRNGIAWRLRAGPDCDSVRRSGPMLRTPPGWLHPSDGIGDHRIFFSVRVDRAGRLHWDGTIVSKETLDEYLDLAAAISPRPQIALVVDEGTDCRTVSAVRRQMVAAAICSTDRLCGEGRGWNR